MDDTDYTGFFDGVDFSDGESFTGFSDNENVDYGWGSSDIGALQNAATDPADFALLDEPDSQTQDLGTTPEPNTGFGTIPDGGDFDYGVDANAGVNKGGTPVAANQGGASQQQQRSTATGGGTKYSQTAGTVMSLLSKGTAKSEGSSPQPNQAMGLIAQLETAVSKTFTGQYKPNTGAAAPVASTHGGATWLLVGAGLIAVALLMKKG